MKSTDIPNGFVVVGQMGAPVLIDFDDNGSPVEASATELTASAPLKKGCMGKDLIALVHTVKGEQQMLIKTLVVLKLNSGDGKAITAVELGKAKRLLGVAKQIRDKFVEDITLKEKNPEAKVSESYKVSSNDAEKAKCEETHEG